LATQARYSRYRILIKTLMIKKGAFIIVDVQFDFLEGGALAVPAGNEIIAPIKNLAPDFQMVVATQDWHPIGHHSFASVHGKRPFDIFKKNGREEVLWPDHCVQGTHGAEIHHEIMELKPKVIIQKGTKIEIDSYSAFFDNHKLNATPLDSWLKEREIKTITIAGLATDYCVKWTVLDGLSLGYEVQVFIPGCRGIKNDLSRDWEEMKNAGAKFLY
jgi:nicotinamidase/pyrazinamidase